jgi:hypothetical protein
MVAAVEARITDQRGHDDSDRALSIANTTAAAHYRISDFIELATLLE